MVLELPGWEFKTTMTKVVRIQNTMVDSRHQQIGKVSSEMESLRKKQNEWLEMKKTQTQRMPLMGLLVDWM